MSDVEPPEDDHTIGDDVQLYRRVSPEHWKQVNGEFVVRDSAFKNFPHPELVRMSVVLGDTLSELKRDPATILTEGQSAFGVVALRASDVREHEQRLERSPRPEEAAHGDVFGTKTTGRRKQFARLATWIIYPSPPDGSVPAPG